MRGAARLALILGVISTMPAAAQDFYVAPQGDDSAPGTKRRPFATLARARDAVREAKSAAKGPLTVWLRGGTYELREPLVLGPEDSGTADCPILYSACPGETPVISGGRRITGWQRGAEGVWTVHLPEVERGEWYFRQLHVNGERRPRARLPKEGLHTIAAPGDPPKRSFAFHPGEIDPAWRNLDDVEIVVLQYWSEARQRIESVDAAANVVRFTGDCFRPANWSRGWYAENVYEGLTEPGQWYLDRKSGVLSYRPLPGEDIEQATVVAPVTEEWVRLDGSPETGEFVEHVTFQGLTFEYSAWSLGERLGYSYPQSSVELTPGEPLWVGWYIDEGLSTPQSQAPVPAAIRARGARHVRFEGNEIAHTGAWAFYLAPGGCRDNEIVGNALHDLGAGAVRVGGPDIPPDPSLATGGAVIADNRVHDCAQVYFGATAIYIGQSSGNRVAHNEVSGDCQWAVSVGWGWGYMPPTAARDNIIEYNHCHDLGTGVLGMHAAIYLLGIQPGTSVRHNLIHHVAAGGSGIALDNSSVGIVVEHNVIHRVAAHALLFNFNDLGNVLQNNVLALADLSLVNRSGDPGKLDQTGVFYHNLFYYRGDACRPFTPDTWANYEIILDHNLYWDATGQPVRPLGMSFAEWQEQGLDRHSVVADPLFADPEHGDFTLRPESPAFALGFQPIDVSAVGPR